MRYFESETFDHDWKNRKQNVSIGFPMILKTDETNRK